MAGVLAWTAEGPFPEMGAYGIGAGRPGVPSEPPRLEVELEIPEHAISAP